MSHQPGCRWFAPGELHEETPRVEELAELEVTERPDFATRGFLAWEDRGDEDFLLWMARNRLNEWCVEPSNSGPEGALRHPAVCWKSSLGAESSARSRLVERMLSVVATCWQQKRSVLEFLAACCRPRLGGKPDPSLVPHDAMVLQAA